VDVDSVADEVYSLPLSEFVSARREWTRKARADGDRELAEAIGKLRKPTVAAWLLNQLARQHPDQVQDLIRLGGRLRAAQNHPKSGQMGALSRQRHELVQALVEQTRAVGRDRGQAVSQAVTGDLEQGFAAVLADPDAAAAVRAGRLATAPHLQAGGWPTTDTENLTRADSPPRRTPDRRLTQARADADDAEQEEANARTALDDAQHHQDQAQAAVRELRARLADAEDAERDAGHALQHAQRARDRAERRVQATRHRLSDIESA
jgi:hypothetical protein